MLDLSWAPGLFQNPIPHTSTEATYGRVRHIQEPLRLKMVSTSHPNSGSRGGFSNWADFLGCYESKISYHNPETKSFGIDPYSGNLVWIPYQQPSFLVAAYHSYLKLPETNQTHLFCTWSPQLLLLMIEILHDLMCQDPSKCGSTVSYF